MSFDKDIKVAVLAGGVGQERPVSLQSGQNIAAAIGNAGLKVITSDITPDDMSILDDASIDVFFLALHGMFGEDGQLQEILESRGLVYTGSGPKASRDAFDKVISKEAFAAAGVPLPRHICVTGDDDRDKLASQLAKIGDTFVVKPIKQGSSVGVEIIDGCAAAVESAIKCFDSFGNCMIEEFISGKEITVGILNGRTLPITEIKSAVGFYDYQAKYIDDTTQYLFDTIKENELIEEINRTALACYNSLGCRHQSRVDMILADDAIAYVLEINTLPGFTSHSLLPMAAKKAGISASRLCLEIIEAALQSFKRRVK